MISQILARSADDRRPSNTAPLIEKRVFEKIRENQWEMVPLSLKISSLTSMIDPTSMSTSILFAIFPGDMIITLDFEVAGVCDGLFVIDLNDSVE